MSTTTDRPTIEERYTRATRSSHLEVKDRPGDVDVLIAAGWVSESLGTMLYRLAAEFDEVKGEMSLAEVEMVRAQKAIDSLYAAAALAGEDDLGPMSKEAERLRDEAERAALTFRLMTLAKLKSLPATKEALGRWAVVQATKRAFMRPDGPVLTLAGRMLNVFLDPNCASCQGRGFNGGFGAAKVQCRACASTGKRRATVGRDAEERQFAGRLLMEMDAMLAEVDRQLRRFLREQSGVA